MSDEPKKDDKKESNATEATDYYNKILKHQFVGDSTQIGSDGEEVVDVVTEYYWIQNKPNVTGKKDMLAPVPFCYAIEYKQRYGVTATNLFNNIYAVSNTANSVLENSGLDGFVASLQTAFDKVKNTINSALSAVTNGGFDSVVNKIDSVKDKISNKVEAPWSGNGHLKTELLKPYLYLYSLEATKKKFCFPFLTDGAASWNVANNFSAEGTTALLSKTISTTLETLADGMVKFAADVQDMSNLLSPNTNANTGFTMYNIEKAKAFSFPAGGKTVRVRFPLFNTIEKGAWEDNYKFIMLFGLRNMLYRKNNVQYYPPLLYDVSIPGFGRMPLSYVKSFTVKPVGMTRVKNINLKSLEITYGNYHKTKETSVIVPEAWIVDIEFESLIADSANQFLSSIFDLPVMVNVETSSETTE